MCRKLSREISSVVFIQFKPTKSHLYAHILLTLLSLCLLNVQALCVSFFVIELHFGSQTMNSKLSCKFVVSFTVLFPRALLFYNWFKFYQQIMLTV